MKIYFMFLIPFYLFSKNIISVSKIDDLKYVDKDKIVFLRSERGGYFEYNKKYLSVNNHCTIFNGWIRKTQKNYINIKWCGAKGDARTDDTEAFNYALKVTYNYRKQNRSLYIPSGTYIIRKKTIIPAKYQGKKNNYLTIFGDGAYDAGQTQIYFIHPQTGNKREKIEYWITSRIQALTIKNIRFKQIYPKGKNIYSYKPFGLLKAKTFKQTADTDTAIINCTFERFYTIVENWGRGLKFTGNTASLSHTPIVLKWGKYPEFPKNIGKDSTGFRAFNIVGNRFHSNGSYAIVNIGKNAKKIHSILISDNLLDVGRGIFKGVLVDGMISNTVAIMTPEPVISLIDGSNNYQVNGLVATGNNNAKRVPNNFIILKGMQENGQFSNITLSNCKSEAINAKKALLDNIIFSNILIKNINNNQLFNFSKNKNNYILINGLMYKGNCSIDINLKNRSNNVYLQNFICINKN